MKPNCNYYLGRSESDWSGLVVTIGFGLFWGGGGSTAVHIRVADAQMERLRDLLEAFNGMMGVGGVSVGVHCIASPSRFGHLVVWAAVDMPAQMWACPLPCPCHLLQAPLQAPSEMVSLVVVSISVHCVSVAILSLAWARHDFLRVCPSVSVRVHCVSVMICEPGPGQA